MTNLVLAEAKLVYIKNGFCADNAGTPPICNDPFLHAKLRLLQILNENVESTHLALWSENVRACRYQSDSLLISPESLISKNRHSESRVSDTLKTWTTQRTLNKVLPLTRLVLCMATIGICSIIAKKP